MSCSCEEQSPPGWQMEKIKLAQKIIYEAEKTNAHLEDIKKILRSFDEYMTQNGKNIDK